MTDTKTKTGKISKDDFELLLDELESLTAARSKPGASTMNDALHRARTALLRAAQIGVDDSEGLVNELNYRRALVQALNEEITGAPGVALFPWVVGTQNGVPKIDAFVNPKNEITKGMKAAAPYGMVVPMASEIEKGLTKVRAKYAGLTINVARAHTEDWSSERVIELAHDLRLAGEEVYNERPNK
jgi:hypothetical protein